MWQALRFCERRGERQSVICTDSLRFVTALGNPSTVDPLLQQIMALHHALEDRGLSFNFVWCPGHVGIQGNEEADAEARKAVDSPRCHTT